MNFMMKSNVFCSKAFCVSKLWPKETEKLDKFGQGQTGLELRSVIMTV